MIKRTFPIENAYIEVSFVWDHGDRSVGIGEGWGEDTGVEIKAGPLSTFIAFEPTDKEPKEWPISEVQTSYNIPLGALGVLIADEPHRTIGSRVRRQYILEDIPEICKVVEETWAQVQAIENLERAGENIWACEEEVYRLDEKLRVREADPVDIDIEREAAERVLEEAKRERDRLQAEYQERYGDS